MEKPRREPICEMKSFQKSHTVPKNSKGGPLGLETLFPLEKYQKTEVQKTNPLKKSHTVPKNSKGGPLGLETLFPLEKYQKTESQKTNPLKKKSHRKKVQGSNTFGFKNFLIQKYQKTKRTLLEN